MEYAAFSANPNDHNDPVGHYLPVPKGVWRLIFSTYTHLIFMSCTYYYAAVLSEHTHDDRITLE